MTSRSLDDVRPLLDAASRAVLTTYRKDGSALSTAVRPFRGVEARGIARLEERDVTHALP